MNFSFLLRFTCVLGFSLLLVNCSSAPKVKRTSPLETIDLSGHWNDSDSRMVAEEMIPQVMDGLWLTDFMQQEGRKPTVIVGTVVNRSHEHINVETFVNDLSNALINSSKVDFVADKQARLEVREEREDMQQGYTDTQTIKAHGKEFGADFMLQGTVSSLKDEIKGKYVSYFQVNLELVNIATNQKKWVGQHKIKKLVKNSRFSW